MQRIPGHTYESKLGRLLLGLALPLLGLNMTTACGSGDDDTSRDAGSSATGNDAGDQDPSGIELPDDVTGSWTMLGYDGASTYHNPHETAISPETAPNLEPAWVYDVRFGQVNGAPAIVGDVVYAVTSTRTYAMRLQTGEVIWENRAASGTASPTYHDGVLYVTGGRATVNALDAVSGELLWSVTMNEHPNAAGYSSPVVADQYVVVGDSSGEEATDTSDASFRGGVLAYHKDSGELAWRFATVEAPHNGVAVWSTVAVDVEDRVVFASTGNNYTGEGSEYSDAILAIDLDTGELKWATQMTENDVFTIRRPLSPDWDFGANPTLFEAEIDGSTRKLVGAGQKSGTFWVLDRDTGEVVWDRAISENGSAMVGGVLNNGAYDGERILVATNNATSDAPGSEPSSGQSGVNRTSVLFALDPANGDILWERQLPAYVWAPITVANGVGFVSTERQIQAFNAATGEKLMSYDVDGTIACGASIANGHVVFGSGMQYIAGTVDRTIHALALP